MVMKDAEALSLARRIALFNSEAIYYVKNSLLVRDEKVQKYLENEHEKFEILINSNSPKTITSNILAGVKNNQNHNIIKIDVDLIKEALLDGINEEGDKI